MFVERSRKLSAPTENPVTSLFQKQQDRQRKSEDYRENVLRWRFAFSIVCYLCLVAAFTLALVRASALGLLLAIPLCAFTNREAFRDWCAVRDFRQNRETRRRKGKSK